MVGKFDLLCAVCEGGGCRRRLFPHYNPWGILRGPGQCERGRAANSTIGENFGRLLPRPDLAITMRNVIFCFFITIVKPIRIRRSHPWQKEPKPILSDKFWRRRTSCPSKSRSNSLIFYHAVPPTADVACLVGRFETRERNSKRLGKAGQP